MRSCCIFLLLCLYPTIAICNSTISISKADVPSFNQFTKNRPIESISDFRELYLRELVENILMQQALRLGGFNEKLVYMPVVDYNHSIQLISAGKTLISGLSIWNYDTERLTADAYISEPIIDDGHFIVGFYTSAQNTKALSANSLNKIKLLSAASNHNWFTDWRTLKYLKIKGLVNTQPFYKMAKLVQQKTVDFTLAPFSAAADLSINERGIRLIPIPNISLALNGSRHVIVSKKHPQGKAAFTALEKGLKQLKQQGKIQEALKQSGFYNKHTKDWPVIRVKSS